MEELVVYSDGGSRGNPGPAAIGFVLQDRRGRTIFEGQSFIGQSTNNVAEYAALTEALKKAWALGARRISCFLDSQLVVRQLTGEYKIKDKKMSQAFAKLSPLLENFDRVTFAFVPREKNGRADQLVNLSLDQHFGKN